MRWAISTILLFAGCATLGSIRSQPAGDGQTRLYRGDLDTVAVAARNSVTGTELRIVEVSQPGPTSWYLIAEGLKDELVRVWCESSGNGMVAVRIIEKHNGLIGQRDWTETIFAQLAITLEPAEARRQ